MSGRKKTPMPVTQGPSDSSAEYLKKLLARIAPNAVAKAGVAEPTNQELLAMSKAFANKLDLLAQELWKNNYQLMQLAYFSHLQENNVETAKQACSQFYMRFFKTNPLVKDMHSNAYVSYANLRNKIKKLPATSRFVELCNTNSTPALYQELQIITEYIGIHFLKHIPLLRIMAKLISIEVNSESPDVEKVRRILADTSYCLNALILEMAIMIEAMPTIVRDAVNLFADSCREHFGGEPVKDTLAETTFKNKLVAGVQQLFAGASGSITDMQHTLNTFKGLREQLNSMQDRTVNSYEEFVSMYLLDPQIFAAKMPQLLIGGGQMAVKNTSRLNLRFRFWNEMLDSWKYFILDCDQQHLLLLQSAYWFYVRAFVLPAVTTYSANFICGKEHFALPELILPSDQELKLGVWTRTVRLATLYGIDRERVDSLLYGLSSDSEDYWSKLFVQLQIPEDPYAAIEYMRNAQPFIGEIQQLNSIMLPAVIKYISDIKVAYLDLSTSKKLSPLQRKIRATYAVQYKPYSAHLKGKYKKQFEQLQADIDASIESVLNDVRKMPDGFLHNAHDVFEFCKLVDEKIKYAVEEFISWLVQKVEFDAVEEEEKKRAVMLQKQVQLELGPALTSSSANLPITQEMHRNVSTSSSNALLVFSAESQQTVREDSFSESLSSAASLPGRLKKSERRLAKVVEDSWGRSWPVRNKDEQKPRGKAYTLDELLHVICAREGLIEFIQNILLYGANFSITTEEFNKIYRDIFGDDAVKNAKKGPGHFLYHLPNGLTAIGHTQTEGGRHQADKKGNIRIIGGKLKDALEGIGLTIEYLNNQPRQRLTVSL